jgi:hypothetical protein
VFYKLNLFFSSSRRKPFFHSFSSITLSASVAQLSKPKRTKGRRDIVDETCPPLCSLRRRVILLVLPMYKPSSFWLLRK